MPSHSRRRADYYRDFVGIGRVFCTFARDVLPVVIKILQEEQERRQKVPRPRDHLAKYDWFCRGNLKDKKVFKARYRMSQDEFQQLFDLLLPHIALKHPTRHSLPEENRLGLTLRFLAGGSYLDLSQIHGIYPDTVYRIVKQVLMGIYNSMDTDFPIGNSEELQRIADGFSKRSKRAWRKCCGALDGSIIRINRPSSKDSMFPDQYFCRKKCYAINMLAICDSQYVFRWFSTRFPGSTHDATGYAVSPLGQRLLHTPLPKGYWIAADGGFACSDGVITPYPGDVDVDSDEQVFNHFHSSTRMHIEQAFGHLKERWGILRRPLETELFQSRIIIQCCIFLHNFLARLRGDNPSPKLGLPPPVDAPPGGIEEPELDCSGSPGSRYSTSASTPSGAAMRDQLRDELIAFLAENPDVRRQEDDDDSDDSDDN